MAKKKTKKNAFSPDLSKYTRLDQEIIEGAETLFKLCPPAILKRSINEIFWAYLCNTKSEDYKPEMKEIATDFYLLIKFLEIAEKDKKETT